MKTQKKPEWIKKHLFNNSKENNVKILIKNNSLHTVCQEARCPNMGECFSNKTAAFLLLGNICTRNCKFCNISANNEDLTLEKNEPKKVAEAVKELGLKYVVLTSVTRDDLPDGGADIFFKTVREIKKINNKIKVEVLVPDFQGNERSIKNILESDISVFNHNLETVERLYPVIRPMANYQQSLNVLKFVKSINKEMIIKTGIMVGLGERVEEVENLMTDFNNIGGDIITIGQYLSPGKYFYPVKKYIEPHIYEKYIKFGQKIGIKKIFAAPFVRSSYLSENIFTE